MFLARMASSSTISTAVDMVALSVGCDQLQRDRRSGAGCARYIQRAAVALEYPPRQRQSEPEPLGLGGMERLENIGELFRGDAGARVADAHLDVPAVAGERAFDRESPRSRHRIQRVCDEAVQYLTDQGGITSHGRQGVLQPGPDLDAAPIHFASEAAQALMYDRIELD